MLLPCYFSQIQWNPVNKVTNGPKKFGGVNRRGIFYKKMYGGFCQAAKKKWL